jgi:hypothetical protein
MNIGEILLLILVVDRAGAADAVAPGKAGVHGAGLATAHGNPTESQDYKADVVRMPGTERMPLNHRTSRPRRRWSDSTHRHQIFT